LTYLPNLKHNVFNHPCKLMSEIAFLTVGQRLVITAKAVADGI
jgi:hypothetical protein